MNEPLWLLALRYASAKERDYFIEVVREMDAKRKAPALPPSHLETPHD